MKQYIHTVLKSMFEVITRFHCFAEQSSPFSLFCGAVLGLLSLGMMSFGLSSAGLSPDITGLKIVS